MSFVAEELNEEQWKAYLALATKHARVLCLAKLIAVDRKRDIVLLICGGRGNLPASAGEPPDAYLLIWRGLAVPFDGYRQREYGEKDEMLVVTVASIGVPKALEHEFEEIKSAIKDAIACWHGSIWSKNGAPSNVIVNFPVPHIY